MSTAPPIGKYFSAATDRRDAGNRCPGKRRRPQTSPLRQGPEASGLDLVELWLPLQDWAELFLSRTGPPQRTRLAATILQPALPGSVRSNRPASGSLSQGSQSQDEQFEVALHRSRQTHRVPPTELATGMPFHLSKTGRSWPARSLYRSGLGSL